MDYLMSLPIRCTIFAFMVAIIITWKRLEETGFWQQVHDYIKSTKQAYKNVFGRIIAKRKEKKNAKEKKEDE